MQIIFKEAGVNSAKLKYLGKRSKLNDKIILTQNLFDYFAEWIGTEWPQYMEAACYFFLNQSSDRNYTWKIDKVQITNELIKAISAFDKMKYKLKMKDITAFKTFEDFQKYLYENKSTQSKSEVAEQTKQSGAILKFKDKNIFIYEILSKEASCFYGAGTKWCITMKDVDYYEDYTAQGIKFWFIINNNLGKEDPLYKLALVVYPIFGTDIDNDDLIGKTSIFDATDREYGGYNAIDKIIESTGWEYDVAKNLVVSYAKENVVNSEDVMRTLLKNKETNIKRYKEYVQEVLSYSNSQEQTEDLLKQCFSKANVSYEDWTYYLEEHNRDRYRTQTDSLSYGIKIEEYVNSGPYDVEGFAVKGFYHIEKIIADKLNRPEEFVRWYLKDKNILYSIQEELQEEKYQNIVDDGSYVNNSNMRFRVWFSDEDGWCYGISTHSTTSNNFILDVALDTETFLENYETICETLLYLAENSSSTMEEIYSFDFFAVSQAINESRIDVFMFGETSAKVFSTIYERLIEGTYTITANDFVERFFENYYYEAKIEEAYNIWKS